MDQSDETQAGAPAGTDSEAPRPGPRPLRRSFSLPPHLMPPRPATALAPPRPAPLPAAPVRPQPAPAEPPRTAVTGFRRPAFGGIPKPPGMPEPANDAAPPDQEDDGLVEIRGKVRRERFRATDSGFTVLVVRLDDTQEERSVQVTTTIRPHEGDRIVARGRWATYKGQPQFKAEMIQLEIPREAKGIAEWLRNGGVPGIGAASIKKLVATYGEGLPEAVEDEEEMARCLGDTKGRALSRAWNCNANQPKLVSLLGGVGLKPKQIARILETYGASIEKVIDSNPWELIDEVAGIGFLTADKIAKNRGLNMTCSPRIQAGLAWVLGDCLARDGHCGMPPGELMASASRMLCVPDEAVEHEMAAFVDGHRTVFDDATGLVYARLLWEAEQSLAKCLAALTRQSRGGTPAALAEEAVLRAERELGVTLDRDGGQFEAAVSALVNPVVVITGGPGTGKSTTQRVIVKAMSFVGKKIVSLAAPTGRAAKRLAETSGQDAKTAHRLLEFNPTLGDFRYNETNRLQIDAAIVDEVSMLDVRMSAALVKALPQDACLVLVGDFDQLPSVGPGQVLRDLISSGLVPVVRLTRVHRQADGSGIAVAAHRINTGLPPVESGAPMIGFRLTDCRDADLIEQIVEMVRFTLPEMGFDPMKDVQVLAPMRKGEYGVEALNKALKAALNPALEGDPNTVQLAGRPFTVGDRVMQTRNDYNKGVYNGEVGTVTVVGTAAGADGARSPFVVVDFSGVEARYRPDEVDDIELAYAATCHKSQGCEFPVVIFAAPRDHRSMLNRNLLYTGITRARLECLLIGDGQTIDAAVRKADSFRRHTGLQTRLAQAMDALDMAA